MDVEGPSEIAEAEEATDALVHLEPSEIVEPSESGAEPNEPAGSPTSHPLEDKMSTLYSSPTPVQDEVSSQRSRSEPCEIIQSPEPPSPLEDGTEAVAASTPRTPTHVSEPQGESGIFYWSTAQVHFIPQNHLKFWK